MLPEGGKLWDQVMAGAPLGHIRFEMPGGRGRKARVVEQEVRARRVMLPDRQGGELEATCLIASEVNAPAGAKPVVWRLLTNRTASTLPAAVELINWYRARWEIEIYHSWDLRNTQMANLSLAFVAAAFRRDRSRARSWAVA